MPIKNTIKQCCNVSLPTHFVIKKHNNIPAIITSNEKKRAIVNAVDRHFSSLSFSILNCEIYRKTITLVEKLAKTDVIKYTLKEILNTPKPAEEYF
ncbi:MAG: hypothetical protein BroJett020_19240 [Bacteroidota bacterium]|nr:MAG: hypothetical protein BroJett020_19240 [Bacteroidota bacterium]